MTDCILPAAMKALRVNALLPDFAGCSVETVPVPQPLENEVLVRIRAASIGFPDLLMTRGEYQFKPKMPFTPGSDIAGDVVAVGKNVTAWKTGDDVVATHLGGGFAEYALYPSNILRAKPPRLSNAEASAFGAAYLTAYVALVRRARLQPGEWVLVHGAAGGVGLAAVDLAKALGAKVIAASASDEKLRSIEADYAPDVLLNSAAGFHTQVREITEGGADVIFDPVGGDIFDESTRCIRFDGRLLVIGFTSGRPATLKTNIALLKGFSVLGVRAGEYGRRFPVLGEENFAAIWALAEAGRVRPRVYAVVALENWREAFEMMSSRQVVGRVVIQT